MTLYIVYGRLTGREGWAITEADSGQDADFRLRSMGYTSTEARPLNAAQLEQMLPALYIGVLAKPRAPEAARELDEWFTKTDWMAKQEDSFHVRMLGLHRADILRAEILRAEIEYLRQQLEAR